MNSPFENDSPAPVVTVALVAIDRWPVEPGPVRPQAGRMDFEGVSERSAAGRSMEDHRYSESSRIDGVVNEMRTESKVSLQIIFNLSTVNVRVWQKCFLGEKPTYNIVIVAVIGLTAT
jgi:hypothetical protein